MKNNSNDSYIADNRRGNVPRLAMFNDIAGFGRCSSTVALPIISVLGVQACPVPTSILSNHLGFPVWQLEDYTPHMHDYIEAWRRLDLHFEGLYCGFLNNPEQLDVVREFLAAFHPGFFLLDPVMGDHGRLYSTVTEAHCEQLRLLSAHADILTPNLTETFLLTGTPYRSDASDDLLLSMCGQLQQLCPKGKIVITGIPRKNGLVNLIFEKGHAEAVFSETAGASRPGTGDIFASILAADALNGEPLSLSVRKAADFICRCIRGSEQAGIPVQEGVIFERYLSTLCRS